MKLEKAIEELERLVRINVRDCDKSRQDALKLGIEGLKVFQESRKQYGTYFARLLPGETAE